MKARIAVATLAAAACAARPTTPAPRVAADTCSSFAQPGVSAATARALEHATSVLEYENIWRTAHPSEASGTVDGQAVQATTRSHSGEIQACYAAALTNSNESGGRVIVRFVIDHEGGVPSASIASSEVRAPELGCCVVKRVAAWQFPKPENGGFVVVEYPFVVRLGN